MTMVIVHCKICGSPRKVLTTARAQTKYCLKHARKRRSRRPYEKKVYATAADFDRSLLPIEIIEATEQFNKGAKFSHTEIRMMLWMGTILPETHLSIDGSSFIVKLATSTNRETKLQRMRLIPDANNS